MLNTATNIIKGVLKPHKRRVRNFPAISWTREKLLKHQEDRLEKKLQIAGYSIHYKRPYELLHAYKEIFENEIYRFSTESLTPVIFDCGSNIGVSVLYFKKLFPQARIIAFEPDCQNYALLERNVSVNNLTDVILNEAAVWVEDGEITFSANESEASHIVNSGGIKVKANRLFSFLDREKVVDFLKMDIEGAEAAVLEDIAPVLSKVKTFFLEYHGKATEASKLTRIFEILRDSGFSIYLRNAADNLAYPFEQKTSDAAYDVQLNIFCYR